jgi:hypothetical protein
MITTELRYGTKDKSTEKAKGLVADQVREVKGGRQNKRIFQAMKLLHLIP